MVLTLEQQVPRYRGRIITFDDQDSFGAAVTINSANLADALAYVASNISTAGDTVAFAYDGTNSGTANGTFVFQQGTNDSVVLLTDVVWEPQ